VDDRNVLKQNIHRRIRNCDLIAISGAKDPDIVGKVKTWSACERVTHNDGIVVGDLARGLSLHRTPMQLFK
jgi:hypothetical protein